jgi:hypothetical protein
MTDRDKLVEAGVKALMEGGLDLYDAALDQFPHNVSLVIDAVEPLIRADEQERHGNNCRGMWEEWLGDLRAKVEALAEKASVRELSDPNAYARRVAYDAVLALLEEDSDE